MNVRADSLTTGSIIDTERGPQPLECVMVNDPAGMTALFPRYCAVRLVPSDSLVSVPTPTNVPSTRPRPVVVGRDYDDTHEPIDWAWEEFRK